MNNALIASLFATGALTTLSGMKGIETENVFRGLLFLLVGLVIEFFVVGIGLKGSGVDNPMTITWASVATASGSGLVALFVQSESTDQD